MFWPGSRPRGSAIRDEGSLLPLRPELNLVGGGVTAVDNAAAGRTDITIPGGGSSYGRQKFDPVSYGATGDWNGSTGTNDTAALQACLDAAAAANGIMVLSKRHRIDAALTASLSCAIIGESPAPRVGSPGYEPACGFFKTDEAGDALVLTGNSVDRGWYLADFTVAGTDDGQYHTAGAGIRLRNSVSSWLERLTVYSHYDCIRIESQSGQNSWANRVRDCEVYYARRHGIVADNSATTFTAGDLYITGCQITNGSNSSELYGSGAGIYLDFQAGSRVTSCGSLGFFTGVNVAAKVTDFVFEDVLADTCGNPWLFDAASNDTIHCTDCYALSSGAGMATGYGSNNVRINEARGVSWHGGVIRSLDSGTEGFYVGAGAAYTDIQGVKFAGAVTYSGTSAVHAGTPLVAASGAHDLKFLNNSAVRGGGTISLGGSHTYLRVMGNTGMGSPSASGTGVTVTDNA